MQVDVNLTRSSADILADSRLGAGSKLYLYTSSTETGTYTLVNSVAIVSGTERYEIVDPTSTTLPIWYKARPGNSAATYFQGDLTVTDASSPLYVQPFLFGSLTAYATLDDLRETLSLGTDTTRDNLLVDLLGDVSADLDAMTGRQFYRSPQVTGTETFYFDVERQDDLLSFATFGRGCHDGKALDIVSVSNLYVRDYETAAYVEISAGDTGYYLQPGMGPGVAGTDWPYEDIALSPACLYPYFPAGRRAVKVIGTRGFPKVPPSVKRAVLGEAAERFRQKINGGALPEGVNQFGTPIFLTGDSPDMRRILRPPFVKRSYAAV